MFATYPLAEREIARVSALTRLQPKHTFHTEHFEVSYRRIDRTCGTAMYVVNGIGMPVYDHGPTARAVDDALRRHASPAESYEPTSDDRRSQQRLFATFGRAVPADAHAAPLRCNQFHDTTELVSGEYGYYEDSDLPGKFRAVALLPDGHRVGVDESHVAPWLRDLVHKFGAEAVFRAARVAWAAPRFGAIFAEHGVPLAAAAIDKADSPRILCIDGTSVGVSADRFNVAQPEKLTPWSRDLLARTDAHAIVLEILNELSV